MSSTRKQAGAPPAAKAKAPIDRKPPAPIFTPLNVGIVLIILILVAVGVFWKSIYLAKTAEINTIQGQVKAQISQNEVYKKKAEMLDTANQINKVMDAKLKQEKKYFLVGQDEVVNFFNVWFWDIILSQNLDFSTLKVEIEPKLTFKISWKAKPQDTLPRLQNAIDLFGWEYIGEGSGTGEVSSNFPDFITPMTLKLTEFTLTYEQMRDFVKRLQEDGTYFVTVHGFKNSGGDDNIYGFRTRSKYELLFTVYFMNPEGTASGDVPKGMPADKKL